MCIYNPRGSVLSGKKSRKINQLDWGSGSILYVHIGGGQEQSAQREVGSCPKEHISKLCQYSKLTMFNQSVRLFGVGD